MALADKIKKVFKTSCELSAMFIRNCKKLLLLDVFLGISREVRQLIITVLPSVAIWLCAGCEYTVVSAVIAAMVAAIAVLGILIENGQCNLSDNSLHATNTLYYFLNGKNARLDLKDAEDGAITDKYYKAFDNIYNFSDVHYDIFCVLIGKLISFVIMSAFIISVDIRLYPIVLAENVIVLIIKAKKDRIDHSFEEKISKNTKRVKYLSELLYDFEAGRDLRVYNGNDMVSNRYMKEILHARSIEIKKQRKDFFIDLIISVLGLGQLFLIYLLAINKYAVGGILLANFILYVSASNQIASSISEIVRTVSELYTASVYYEDFNEYMELKETIREKGNDIPFAGSSVPFIEFKNVSFKYPNQESYSLENFSCSIEYGDHISIVGDNGAGKSTFVKLLLRLYEPTAGTICYKGKDIREYDFDSYQAVFAPVFQDYVLNAFSIRENLIFDYDERNDRIKPALEKTGMYDKIVNIGLDRPYSRKFFEDGIELSGGEQQRLVISRAYCKNSEVLILDEPTAAIDPLSERRLFEDIFSNIGEVTSIMIAHRMSCSKFSNRIFVMDHGRLVEQGSHGELMGKNGLYASMYNRQAQYYS